jgi:hypothetical protein
MDFLDSSSSFVRHLVPVHIGVGDRSTNAVTTS